MASLWVRLKKVVRSLESYPWRRCWNPQTLISLLSTCCEVNMFPWVHLLWWAGLPEAQRNRPNHLGPESPRQNKSFLFSIWWSQIFCYSNWKWIRTHVIKKKTYGRDMQARTLPKSHWLLMFKIWLSSRNVRAKCHPYGDSFRLAFVFLFKLHAN